uniref:Charged multivesicular body protein 2a n=1 Tax=Corethron hystrix TaxID=216773 RepID=A0A7S1BRV2_9STRA|mmetsp:Transcript_36377/g.85062  ORF Transcript_36377/g.85062 Transcript_36377/m.85062 type:complete len:223 (+) Transcript_36377:407-1075(+)|eukprot:CAMPEP_0113313148 /NCGR_PEP_ID=MMETSP0010_2-20120614/9686_1 /TAXON_ID=216773 ORGANISM="Corethron hystrix, Strain 308" /NCGR_SAMPLE_ID=MMETSP0010_2 /ASSEMBLY_ACC=CAM_ASM_000155 /LENGTH=222 /DNA_ID=CAMNT_0000169099 /DNA_START=306 /DNA_END=974 /DNA_ORIENTATION=- /assembly_acc=CAM_ASM_000155
MGAVFGKGKTLKEVIRENKREINKSIRELDREKNALEKEEKRLITDIKKQAKAGQHNSVRIMAKDLVRTRQYITKFIEMRSHLQGVALKLQTVKSQTAMAEAMTAAGKSMMKFNKAIDIPRINKMMADFMKENEKSELVQEMLGDAIDDTLEQEGDAEETEKIVSQVLDEIGIDFDENIPDAPLKPAGVSATPTESKAQPEAIGANDAAFNDLEARLNNLKK